MAYSYKGAINFGFVYIPVTLHNCIKTTDIGFNMLDKKNLSRISYKKVNSQGKEVKQEDIIKGFEYESGKYVVFDETDFEKIKSEKEKSITIEQFVSLDEIDPIYFEKPYYVVPTGAEKAFRVLLEAMKAENKVAIARTVLGKKDTLIAIRAKDQEMLLNTLYYFDEVQKSPLKDLTEKATEKEIKLAKQLIISMSETFKPEQYKNIYNEKVKKAIQQKIAGKEIKKIKTEKNNELVDLMDALQASLRNSSQNKKKAVKKVKNKNLIIEEDKTINSNA